MTLFGDAADSGKLALRKSESYRDPFERNHVEGTNVSLLTGLRASTNFSRPNFESILPKLRNKFSPLPISIFTCGPPPLAAAVENGTRTTNLMEDTTVPLRHHYVSF